MKRDDLMNLCFAALMDGGTEHRHLDLAEAREALAAWAEEDGDLAEDTRDLAPEALVEAWNFCVDLAEALDNSH